MKSKIDDKLEEIKFLQQTAHIGSWFWNIQTNERSWSDESYRILGLPPSDKRLNPDTVIGFIHPEDKVDTLQAFRFAIENRIPFSFENRIVRPDGEIRYVLGSGKTTYDVNENPETMFGTMQDITDQKIREEKLRQSEARSRAFLETLPDLISIMDKDGTVLQINESQHIPFFGTSEEVVGRNVADIVPAPAGPQFVRALAKAHRSRKLVIEEMAYLYEGMQFTFEVRVIPMEDGKLMNIARNITDQKTKELQLIEKEDKNKAILRALPDLMVVFNEQGVYLDAQAPDSMVLPTPAHELIGGNLRDFMPNGVSDKFFQAFTDVQKTGRPRTLEYSLEVINEIRYYEARIVSQINGNFLAIIRDITAKKIKDDILYIRNRALAVAPSGIVIVDARQADLPMIYANTTFLKLVGYDEEEIIGRNCRLLQGTDRSQKEIKIMGKAIKDGKACTVVLRNYRKDGSMFWNELSVTPVFNDKRELTHWIGVQNDVTVRKQEELFKEQIRTIMAMLIQHKPLKAIADKIVETLEMAIPNSIATILLRDKDEDILYKLSAPNLPMAYDKFFEKGVPIGPNIGSCGTAAHLKKEVIVSEIANDPLWKDYKSWALADNLEACWSFPLLSSENEVMGIFAIYSNEPREPLDIDREHIDNVVQIASVAIEQDKIDTALQNSKKELLAYAENLESKVTERTNELQDSVQKLVESNLSLEDQILATKEAETKLIENQKLFSAIAKKFPRGIISVFNQDFRILYSEGEGKETVGLQNYPFTGKAIDEIDVFPDETKADLRKYVEETLTGKHLTFEREFNGVTFIVYTMPLANDMNEITRALMVHYDVSEQKKVEQDILIALQKEQELSELKSNFVTVASHEFRTPLSAILSAANLIERQNTPEKAKVRIKYTDLIKSSVKQLVVILNDFLSLSKLEEGKISPQPTTFDLVGFSKTLIDEVHETKKKGQTITLVTGQSNIEVVIDRKLLRHIALNLLSNAIKYSEEGKKIKYKIDVFETIFRIEVVDEGIGIPIENQANLFERFYRADNTLNIQGTGLGLNIVKQYVELMGGSINFESKLNEGTTFLVELPLNQKKYEKNTTN